MLKKLKLFIQKNKMKSIGKNVIIDKSLVISNSNNISIGDNCYIGPFGALYGLGGITIENSVIIGPRVIVYSSNHNYKMAKSIPYDKEVIKRPVYIETGVWIGDSVKIVPGVRIGRGSIIGLGSVVTKDVEPFSIMGGNPAKLIKKREEKDIENFINNLNNGKEYIKLKLEGKL